MDKLQLEDTVSADRKERIIFDPDAWRKSDKSGRKTSAITSRQNFDNEKFTRKAKKGDDEELEESTIQTNDTSKVESGGPEQSDTISKDKPKKSNNPQIEFVTGTATPNGSSSTAIGNAQNMGIKKISEAIVKKAIAQVTEGRMKDKVTDADFEPEATNSEKAPFDGPYTKSPDVVVDKSGARHTPMSRARDLARKAIAKQAAKKSVKEAAELDEAQYAGLEKEDKPGKVKTAAESPHKKGVNIDTVEGWKDQKPAVKEESEKLNKEGQEMKSYQEFLNQLLEYTPGPGGVTRVQGRSYGAQYHDPEGDDDADDRAPAAKPADEPKRGRGRPKLSKSGANHKVTKGKSYGGIPTHSLNLPNSNR